MTIEEMARMDVLRSDKTVTLTLNKLSVDRNLIEVFAKVLRRSMLSFLLQGPLGPKIRML